MLHQVGISFDLYYDARKHKIKIQRLFSYINFRFTFNEKKVKFFVWSADLYGAVTWTLRNLDLQYFESFGMWCWRRNAISWTDRGGYKEVLRRVNEDRNILRRKKKGRLFGFVISWVECAF